MAISPVVGVTAPIGRRTRTVPWAGLTCLRGRDWVTVPMRLTPHSGLPGPGCLPHRRPTFLSCRHTDGKGIIDGCVLSVKTHPSILLSNFLPTDRGLSLRG